MQSSEQKQVFAQHRDYVQARHQRVQEAKEPQVQIRADGSLEVAEHSVAEGIGKLCWIRRRSTSACNRDVSSCTHHVGEGELPLRAAPNTPMKAGALAFATLFQPKLRSVAHEVIQLDGHAATDCFSRTVPNAK